MPRFTAAYDRAKGQPGNTVGIKRFLTFRDYHLHACDVRVAQEPGCDLPKHRGVREGSVLLGHAFPCAGAAASGDNDCDRGRRCSRSHLSAIPLVNKNLLARARGAALA